MLYSHVYSHDPPTILTNVTSNKFKEKIKELIKSVIFMRHQFDEFNKKLDAALLNMNHLRTENDQIKTENIWLANKILEIKQKLDTIEQTNIGIGIEITDVPKIENENCMEIVKEIVKKLNITKMC